jgi:hypothetical protein
MVSLGTQVYACRNGQHIISLSNLRRLEPLGWSGSEANRDARETHRSRESLRFRILSFPYRATRSNGVIKQQERAHVRPATTNRSCLRDELPPNQALRHGCISNLLPFASEPRKRIPSQASHQNQNQNSSDDHF